MKKRWAISLGVAATLFGGYFFADTYLKYKKNKERRTYLTSRHLSPLSGLRISSQTRNNPAAR